VRQLFVVVNKMDLVPEDERAGVIDFVKSKAQEEAGRRETCRVYAVSARDARGENGDRRGQLDGSGLLPLQET